MHQFSLTSDEMITQVLSFPSFLQPKADGVDVMKRTQDEYMGRWWMARRNESEPQQSLVSTSDASTHTFMSKVSCIYSECTIVALPK